MSEFNNFNEWCHYWSAEFSRNIYKWRDIVNKAIDNDDESNQYLFAVDFNSSVDAHAAMSDICKYGEDRGYGEPSNFIDNDNSDRFWRVYLTCPNTPFVIRMINNHGGHIYGWNTKFLKQPPQHIPFYIPTQPKSKKHSSGCYIATAVYGSYDCPEVWTLRRYRDNVLDNSWYGRLFIKCYYSISPTLVKWFGETYWFRNIFHRPLNKWIAKLNKKGFENTPYCDKY